MSPCVQKLVSDAERQKGHSHEDRGNDLTKEEGSTMSSESELKCPNCGYIMNEPDWRCPKCYCEFVNYDFDKNQIIGSPKVKQTLNKKVIKDSKDKKQLKKLPKKQDVDFLTIYPKAVLVLSPLPSKKLTDDWLVKFLAIAIGSKLGHKDINNSFDLISKFGKSGMLSGIRGDVQRHKLKDAIFCEQEVKRAFPNIVNKPYRVRFVQIDDSLHSNILTTIIWLFPPLNSNKIQNNTKRNCTYKNKQIKLINSGFQNYIICSESNSCTKNCIHNLAELIAVLVAAKLKGVKSDSDSLKKFALQTGSKDYTSD